MNRTIGIQLVIYSALLAGLSYLAYHLVPALARPTLIAGLAGSVLCLVWGLRAVAGHGGKALPILTLVAVNFILLSQVVTACSGGGQGAQGRRATAVVITLLFLFSLGMLMRIAYAGVVFGAPPTGSMKEGGTQ